MAAQQIISATVPAVTIAATADQTVGRVRAAGRVTAVTYTPEAAITGAASPNSRTFTLVNKAQDGLGAVTIATLAMTSGVNGVAFDEKAVTLSSTASDKVVAEGDILVWVSTAVTGGGGLVDPGGNVVVTIGATAYSDVASAVGTVAQTES
jgi:YD repeat-containing protein